MHYNSLKERIMKSKEQVIKDIVKIIRYLHEGKLEKIDPLLDMLKKNIEKSDFEEDGIDFIQQVEFQKDYDHNHLLTKEIKDTADKLLKDLGVPISD